MTDLMKIEDFKGDLATVAGIFDVKDNLKGVQGRIPQIKIIHQGQIFSNVDGSNTFAKFTGIILHHSPVNAWWKESYEASGGGSIPDCSSMNGVEPNVAAPQSAMCFDCDMNKWGSADNGTGKGKACKNSWRLHILEDGTTLPKRLTLPPALNGQIQDFLMNLAGLNIPHELAVVEFSLEKTKNKEGIAYSMVKFNIKGVINTKEKALEIKKIIAQFSVAFGEEIIGEELSESSIVNEKYHSKKTKEKF